MRVSIEVIHYLDDFLLFGPPGSLCCERALSASKELCAKLGVPLAAHKMEGPSTRITFLGIELDTEARTVRLPEDKLRRLQREIRVWRGRKICTKRDLLSLIGQLQHACCVVKPGRTFLRRMIDLSSVAKELHHRIRLNKGFRSDLQWWSYFLPRWNGHSMMSGVIRERWDITLTSVWGWFYASASQWPSPADYSGL